MREIIQTPKSNITIVTTKGDVRFKHSITFICHTQDMDSLKKSLIYIIERKLNERERTNGNIQETTVSEVPGTKDPGVLL